MKESAVDCSLYANSEDLVCFNYGKVMSTQFGSVPAIEEDQYYKEDAREQKRKFRKYTEGPNEYAVDKENNEVFTMEAYKELLQNPRAKFDRIGILEKRGRKDVIVKK